MRLFLQDRPGEWKDLFDRVATELGRKLKTLAGKKVAERKPGA
jgi:hypothetical protein